MTENKYIFSLLSLWVIMLTKMCVPCINLELYLLIAYLFPKLHLPFMQNCVFLLYHIRITHTLL